MIDLIDLIDENIVPAGRPVIHALWVGCAMHKQDIEKPSVYIEILLGGNHAKGGDAMVTYSELFQFVLVLVAIASLTYKMSNRK